VPRKSLIPVVPERVGIRIRAQHKTPWRLKVYAVPVVPVFFVYLAWRGFFGTWEAKGTASGQLMSSGPPSSQNTGTTAQHPSLFIYFHSTYVYRLFYQYQKQTLTTPFFPIINLFAYNLVPYVYWNRLEQSVLLEQSTFLTKPSPLPTPARHCTPILSTWLRSISIVYYLLWGQTAPRKRKKQCGVRST